MTTTLDTPKGTDPSDNTGRPADAVQPENNGSTAPEHRVEAAFLNPNDLVIADNVRRTFDLSDYPDYTASIDRHGVLTPIKAERMPDGSIAVRDGQLRTLIALELGLTHVPVWITTAVDPGTAEYEITRRGEQITVNDRRIPLTDGDRAVGIAETHDVDEGLLLRSDIHRLLDAGLIAVDPTTMTVVVAPTIKKRYPAYGALEGVPLANGTYDLALADHHKEATATW